MNEVKSMRLKPGILGQLRMLGQNHLLIKSPMSPCMLTALQLDGTPHEPGTPASFELSWSGLQLLSSDGKTVETLISKGAPPFALEGVGFISFAAAMFENYSETSILALEDITLITEMVSNILACTLHPESAAEENHFMTAIQKDRMTGMPEGTAGFQLHLMLSVSEGTWVGLYQLHMQELKLATKFYQNLKGLKAAEEDLSSEVFSTNRTLN